jgi:hypothetical protein
MQPVELQDDLKAEVTLTLLELDHNKLIQIHNSGGLKYYAVRIILNSIQSKTSPFYKKYRSRTYEFFENNIQSIAYDFSDDHYADKEKIKCDSNNPDEEQEQFNNRLCNELKELKVMDIINGLYWYDKEMVRLYIELGSYRKIEEATGIAWRSCYDTIQSAFSKIKYELRRQHN